MEQLTIWSFMEKINLGKKDERYINSAGEFLPWETDEYLEKLKQENEEIKK